MKPIPKIVLNATAKLYKYTSVNDYGEPTWDTHPINLSGIYCEPANYAQTQALGEQQRYEMILYFDMVNSGPKGVAINLHDKVVLENEKEYRVRSVNEYYNPITNDVHHLRVLLYAS